MVVLSVALVTRTGRALLSRQFVEANRMRVEGLLAAFPKLVADSGAGGKQHTYAETDSIRYVYAPLESSMYLVLITNRGSNIIEDLDTLRLLAKVISEQLSGMPITEEAVTGRAFELIFAFDEVISAGGYREDVTLGQIRVNLEMESHEEKLAQMIKASKMAQAKEAAKKQAAIIRERNREKEKQERMAGMSSDSMGSGGGGGGGGRYGSAGSGDDYHPSYGGSAAASSSASSMRSAPPPLEDDFAPRKPAAAPSGASRMVLGGAKKAGGGLALGGGKNSLAGIIAEEGLSRDAASLEVEPSSSSKASSAAAAAAAAQHAAAAAVANQVNVDIEERLTVALTRDGAVESMEVKGTLKLTVNDEAQGRLKVVLQRGDTGSFQFQPHPHINKTALLSDGVIMLKAPEKPFPGRTPLGMVRWTRKIKDAADASSVPLALTCWPEAGGNGLITVNLEYNLQDEFADTLSLNDVVITVPLGTENAPKVSNCSVGEYKHNTRENCLTWHIDSISSENTTGSLEFSIKSRNEDGFFPVSVAFRSDEIMCPLAVKEVLALDDDHPLRFGATKAMEVDSYTVQ